MAHSVFVMTNLEITLEYNNRITYNIIDIVW